MIDTPTRPVTERLRDAGSGAVPAETEEVEMSTA
jgi:hypothetical protein